MLLLRPVAKRAVLARGFQTINEDQRLAADAVTQPDFIASSQCRDEQKCVVNGDLGHRDVHMEKLIRSADPLALLQAASHFRALPSGLRRNDIQQTRDGGERRSFLSPYGRSPEELKLIGRSAAQSPPSSSRKSKH